MVKGFEIPDLFMCQIYNKFLKLCSIQMSRQNTSTYMVLTNNVDLKKENFIKIQIITPYDGMIKCCFIHQWIYRTQNEDKAKLSKIP